MNFRASFKTTFCAFRALRPSHIFFSLVFVSLASLAGEPIEAPKGAKPSLLEKEMPGFTYVTPLSDNYSYGSKGNDGPAAMQAIAEWTEITLSTGEWFKVEPALTQAAITHARLLDGRWKLSALAGGMDDYCHRNCSSGFAEKLAEWEQTSPKSILAAIGEAVMWREAAWRARGPGMANTVPKEGWKLFRKRLRKAEDALLRSKEYSATNPLWYSELLEVRLGLQYPKKEIWELFQEAISREPSYYPHYFQMVRILSPQWGGSVEEIDHLANEAVELTRDTEGNSLYARIYWFVDQSLPVGDLFRNTPVDWSRMKRGFDDLIRMYPLSVWNRSNYAAFACRAGDAQTYREVRSTLAGQVMEEAFSGISVRLCDEKLNSVLPPIK